MPAIRTAAPEFRKSRSLWPGRFKKAVSASLNRRTDRRYRKSPSVTAFKEFPGQAHHSIIGARGWEEVSDYALDWAVQAQETSPSPVATAGASQARREEALA